MLTGTAWGQILPFKEAAASLHLHFLRALRQRWDARLLLLGTQESPALTCPLWPQPWDGGSWAQHGAHPVCHHPLAGKHRPKGNGLFVVFLARERGPSSHCLHYVKWVLVPSGRSG